MTDGEKRARFYWWATLGSWVRLRRAELLIVSLLLPFLILSLLIKSPSLRHWDAHITHLVQHTVNPTLTFFCEKATWLGSGGGLILVTVPALIWLAQRQRPIGSYFLLASILGHLLNIPIKMIFNRPRPGATDSIDVILKASGTSFPSGHAMTAVMFFGFLAVLIIVQVPSRLWRRVWVTLSVAMALFICFSRVYLGAHFVSDIVGGILCGLLFLLLWIEAYKRFAPKEFLSLASNAKDSDTETVSTKD